MNEHRYLTSINDQTWGDLTTIKGHLNTSFNQLINDGCRLVVKENFQKVMELKERSEALATHREEPSSSWSVCRRLF